MKNYNIFSILTLVFMLCGCTDLDETVYDQVTSQNFYNTRQDVERAVIRPFEHNFHLIQHRHFTQELTADQIITPSRDGWWDDAGKWRRFHYHTWTAEDGDYLFYLWNDSYMGIGQCNNVMEDLAILDHNKFGFTQEEFDNYIAQCRTLRAFFYMVLIDGFRNCPLVVSFNDQSKNTETQVAPEVLFKFIEDELKESLKSLTMKESLGTQNQYQGMWTKASAAALLARLYLNAEVYIGQDRYADCEKMCQDIVSGVYGPYEVAGRWDAAFDWDNNNCDEVIFGIAAGPGYSFWHYHANTYWWTVPVNAYLYLNDQKCKAGGHNTKYAASPSYDLNGKLYDYKLGMPIQKFRKYEGDYRMKLYRNLGNGRREGLFLYGYLEYTDENGEKKKVRAPERPYDLYIRDAVGNFQDLAPNFWPSSKTSNLTTGDHNSGWHYVKYPMYSDDDEHQLQADYTEIRLPEIIYMLAECKLRHGNTTEAAKLLNSVRRRNYPEENLPDVLYEPEGRVKLDLDEMLDEWGREFFAETRRRTDLIRFGKFSSGTWWDKTPDADNHTELFPLSRQILDSNPKLVQNPGYGK